MKDRIEEIETKYTTGTTSQATSPMILIKKKLRKTKINNVRNKKEDIIDASGMRKKIRGYCEKFYTNKTEDICEVDKLLEIYNLLMLTQPEIGNLNNPTTIKEVELEVENLPMKKT